MNNFPAIFLWVLKIEDGSLAGNVVNLFDGQGRTRYGVGEFSHPNLPVDFYTCDSAKALVYAEGIYKTDYWDRFLGDLIEDDGVASCLLSFSINDGTQREISLLQQVLGFTVIDGIMGPVTLSAANKMPPVTLAASLRAAQAGFYKMLIAKQPTDARFEDGWMRRANLIYPCLS